MRGLDPSKGPIKAVRGQFSPPTAGPLGKSKPATEPTKQKPSRASKPKAKFDPKYLAAARELRDRYLEQFNAGTIAAEWEIRCVSDTEPQSKGSRASPTKCMADLLKLPPA